MDNRMLAALLSSIICELAIILLLLTPSPLPLTPHSSSSFSLWPLLMDIFQSSQLATSFLEHDEDEEEEGDGSKRSKRRRRLRVDNIMGDSSFRATFRMCPSTFEWLCTQTEPFLLGYGNSNLTVSQQVGMGLFRLATGSDYDIVAQRFGSTEPTARLCTKHLIRLLCRKFRSCVVYPPTWALPKISADFESIGGLPNCCGAIDCTRFKFTTMGPGAYRGRIDTPGNDSGDVCDKDEDFSQSMVMQIVVDSSCRVLNLITGFSGDKGDSRVLRSSTLYSEVEQGQMLNSRSVCLNGVTVPQYLVGDNGYPLLPWLMVPFTEPLADSCQEDFNSKHYVMHQVALRTLASLRRWGVLSKNMEEEDVRVCVGCVVACVILHNIVLSREQDGGVVLEGVEEDYALDDGTSQYYRDDNDEQFLIEKKAAVIRNALALRARGLQNSVHETDPSH